MWNLQKSTILKSIKTKWKTIPIEQEITNKMCNIFEIEITANKACSEYSERQNAFFIGFVKDTIENMDASAGLCQSRKNTVECIKTFEYRQSIH